MKGKEFARHKEIAKGLDAEFYFARPYHSWERGANENTNGLIRQYIPKCTDFILVEGEVHQFEAVGELEHGVVGDCTAALTVKAGGVHIDLDLGHHVDVGGAGKFAAG